MDEDKISDVSVQRSLELARERRRIMQTGAEKIQEAILEHPQPAALVHSFPEEDLYFLIHEIGLEDALPILSLASYRQWDYFIDVEVWQRDRLQMETVLDWLNLLQQAAPKRFVHWAVHERLEFMEYCLLKNIEVGVKAEEQEASEFPENFFSLDDLFFIRFREDFEENEQGRLLNERRKHFLYTFLQNLAYHDLDTYHRLLIEFPTLISAESEEESYRERNIRLAEKGFKPFEEAVGIYQPLKPEAISGRGIKTFVPKTEKEQTGIIAIPQYPVGLIDPEHPFMKALDRIDDSAILEQIELEFVGLCNVIGSADQSHVRNRQELEEIVKKACGYIRMGMESLVGTGTKKIGDPMAYLVQKYPLENIFRIGYGAVLSMRWESEKWVEESWFKNLGFPMTFWGEKWTGALGGILLKKPLYFDNYTRGVLYREFQTLDEVERTRETVRRIMAFDRLLASIQPEIDPETKGMLDYKNLVLTAWVRDYSGLPKIVTMVEREDFQIFYRDLWTGNENERRVRKEMKQSFLQWLTEKSGWNFSEISAELGPVFDDLFGEIETELGHVSEKNLDPRFINLFLIRSSTQA